MLEPGQRVPEASLWTGPRERTTVEALVADGPALFLFYLFDWSAT
jgi:hypothetical protein